MGVAFYYEDTGTMMESERTRILVSFDSANTYFVFDANGVKDWGDGSVEDSALWHTYEKVGTYVIETNAYIGGNANAQNNFPDSEQYVKAVEIAPENLGNRAFEETGLVAAIIRPQRLSFGINHDAFRDCRDLKYVNLPQGTSEIGFNAFKGCESLEYIYIPSSVTRIDFDAFKRSGLVSIYIPSSVTEIGNGAFADCTSLVAFAGGDACATLGYGAFEWCTRLANVQLSPLLTSLESSTFRGCTSLQFITLPSTLEEIHNNVFSNSGLIEITLPNTLTMLGSAFIDATELQNVTYLGTVAQWNAIDKYDTPFDSGIVVHCTDGDVTY